MFKQLWVRVSAIGVAVMMVALLSAQEVYSAGIKTTFYGNQYFKFVSPGGTVVLINPWVKGNKDAGHGVDMYKKGDVDLILATAGHGDDQGNTVEIAARTGATIFVVAELGVNMASRIEKFGGSKKQVYGGAISGRKKVGDVTVQIMLAQHGSGFKQANDPTSYGYGGPAAGFLLTFDNGFRIYMAGSTGLTMDLQLYGMRYKPDVAMLPMFGRYMMHPDDAAYAAKLLMTDNPNLKTLVPQHFRVKGAPPWGGTPAQFEAEVKKLGLPLTVVTPVPGEEFTLGG